VKIRVANLSASRRALVHRWMTRALEEMYESEGKDKGFTPEETRVIHLTVDDVVDKFRVAEKEEA